MESDTKVFPIMILTVFVSTNLSSSVDVAENRRHVDPFPLQGQAVACLRRNHVHVPHQERYLCLKMRVEHQYKQHHSVESYLDVGGEVSTVEGSAECPEFL